MRRAIAALCALVVVMGIGVVIPGVAGTASACSCAVQREIPPDLVVIRGVVQAQRVGFRDTDLQVRVSSMYGAPPEKVTVIRTQSATYTSCGSRFDSSEQVTLVVKRQDSRWVHPVCGNAVLSSPSGASRDLPGESPGPDAPETRLSGAPQSWLFHLRQPFYLESPGAIAGAIVAVVILVGLVVWIGPRFRRR